MTSNTKMVRDALGSPVPQTLNEDDNTYTVLANGDVTGVDFSKYKLLRDALGSPLPYQYFDVAEGKFVEGVLNGGSGGSVDLTPVNNRLTSVEQVNTQQNTRLDALESGSGSSDFTLLGDILLSDIPSSFEDGEYVSTITITTSSYSAYIGVLNGAAALTLPVTVQLLFINRTIVNRSSNTYLQIIDVYQNGSAYDKFGTMQRVAVSDGSRWNNFSYNPNTIRYSGNPSSSVSAIKGTMILDTQDNVTYINNSATNAIGRAWLSNSELIRTNQRTSFRTEVVNSLPTTNLNNGRIVFDASDSTFKGYNGTEWMNLS